MPLPHDAAWPAHCPRATRMHMTLKIQSPLKLHLWLLRDSSRSRKRHFASFFKNPSLFKTWQGNRFDHKISFKKNAYKFWVLYFRLSLEQATFNCTCYPTTISTLSSPHWRIYRVVARFLLRSALFCRIMQRRMAILYRRFGTTYRSHKDPWRWDRYVVPKRL
jgi:hypothetical protein